MATNAHNHNPKPDKPSSQQTDPWNNYCIVDTFHHTPQTKNTADKTADTFHYNPGTESNCCNTEDKTAGKIEDNTADSLHHNPDTKNIADRIADTFHHTPDTKSNYCNIADKPQSNYTYSSTPNPLQN
ncbi:MAG TPA: hypothetical protein VE862_06660 [Candidatus Acidoferrum sp.]|nr:hypothetical protein [Candidatus Acidoferrum sp.]